MTGVHRPDRPAHLRWRKASASSIGNCVEVAADCGEVLLRDSKDPTGPWIRYTAAEWDAFIQGAKDGEFDSLV
jgi:hypothetical protein